MHHYPLPKGLGEKSRDQGQLNSEGGTSAHHGFRGFWGGVLSTNQILLCARGGIPEFLRPTSSLPGTGHLPIASPLCTPPHYLVISLLSHNVLPHPLLSHLSNLQPKYPHCCSIGRSSWCLLVHELHSVPWCGTGGSSSSHNSSCTTWPILLGQLVVPTSWDKVCLQKQL